MIAKRLSPEMLDSLLEKKKTIYVRNKTNPRGIVSVMFIIPNVQKTITKMVYVSAYPQAITDEVPHSTVGESYDFRRYLMKGILELVDPDEAKKELTADALKELQGLRMRDQNFKRRTVVAPRVITGIGDRVEELTEFEPPKGWHTSEPPRGGGYDGKAAIDMLVSNNLPKTEATNLIRKGYVAPKVEMGFEFDNISSVDINPRVMDIVMQSESGGMKVKEAIGLLRGLEDLFTEADIGYLISKGVPELKAYAEGLLAQMDKNTAPIKEEAKEDIINVEEVKEDPVETFQEENDIITGITEEQTTNKRHKRR